MYFFRLGFLDGLHGFHFCVMHAVFQQFVVVKQWEMKQNVIDRAYISRGSPESMPVPNRSNSEDSWIHDEAENQPAER
jgi:hypothetical protein